MNQDWFEMYDIRRKNFNESDWIPLRAFSKFGGEGDEGYEGYKEESFDCCSVAIPTKDIAVTARIEGFYEGFADHPGWNHWDGYTPVDTHKLDRGRVDGLLLVIDKPSFDDSSSTWHLNQDFALALDLIREGNSWVCPMDGYAVVVRLKVNADGNPFLIEVKSEYLKDYLCARDMSLYMNTRYSRVAIVKDNSFITWPEGSSCFETESYSWNGSISPAYEDCMMTWREGRYPDSVESTESDSWEEKNGDEGLYEIHSDLQRNDIIEPGKVSPKTKGDHVMPAVPFIIDVDGSKVCGKDLFDSGKYLWFKPDVIMALYHRRGGGLSFSSAMTGTVEILSNYYGVDFGVNELGLINVYAKKIAWLPEWQQKIWAGYNIPPEGGVSSELFAKPVGGGLLLAEEKKACRADTQAPENILPRAFQDINALSEEKLGIKIFRHHELMPELLNKIHRFRAVDEASFYSLARDIARLIASGLDTAAMQTIVTPAEKTKWESIKSLEHLLASKYDRDSVRAITASLAGVYDLRDANAHLPSSKVEEAFDLLEIDRSEPFIHQGYQMLQQVASSLRGVVELLERWPSA